MSCVYDIYLFMCMSRTIAEFVYGDLRKWSPLQSVKLLGRSDAFASDNKCSQTCVSLSNALSPSNDAEEMRKVEARRNEHEKPELGTVGAINKNQHIWLGFKFRQHALLRVCGTYTPCTAIKYPAAASLVLSAYLHVTRGLRFFLHVRNTSTLVSS